MHVQQNNSFVDTRRSYLNGGGASGPKHIEQPETCLNCGNAVDPRATVCGNCKHPVREEE